MTTQNNKVETRHKHTKLEQDDGEVWTADTHHHQHMNDCHEYRRANERRSHDEL